ncbi:MAG: FdtA/QdtA family cupin domain-containing protein [Conexivisphaerales archaeon]
MNECLLIEFKKVSDSRGSLTVIESLKDIPFEIKRVYYIYDVPTSSYRGGHAHRNLQQVMIATSGSFDVIVDNGHTREKFSLNKPYVGLYIPRMVWREMDNFSSGSVCLVLASDYFNESDYIRDYQLFLKALKEGI